MVTQVSPETIEGRLIAQRKLLARLVAQLGDKALWQWLDDRSMMQDHQEDPGAVPAPGIGIEAAIADEIRHIRTEAARVAASGG